MRSPKLGFTLIELLVTNTVICLIFLWLTTHPQPDKVHQWEASMRNSLTQSLEAQQKFYNKHGRYLLDIDSLHEETGYRADKHVTVTLAPINTGAVTGFRAIATHQKTSTVCLLGYGTEPKGTEVVAEIMQCSPLVRKAS